MEILTVETYVEQLPENHRVIAHKLRQLVQETAPSLTETIKWGSPCYSGKKNLFYFASKNKHINFGFYDASEILDKSKLLEGTGKKMRHVKIRSLESLPENELRNLIMQAVV